MTRNINTLWYEYLVSQGYSGSTNDMIREALQSETSSTLRDINDLWKLYFTQEGVDGSHIDTMAYNWLGDKGYEGSLNDRWVQALTDGDIFEVVP